MKHFLPCVHDAHAMSHTARGAWIETSTQATPSCRVWSHPARGAWIETTASARQNITSRSHPARGAWIETLHIGGFSLDKAVAPREGCVD